MYVKLVDGVPSVFPFNLGDLRQENPNVSFPSPISDNILAKYNVYPVTLTTPPQYDNKTHRVVQGVLNVDGSWTQVWTLEELPFDQAASNVRGHRTYLLAGCDWTQLPDAPVDHETWATYRQDLRDVTAQAGFPWDIVWPVPPA
jgi:hypothetical protein